MKKILLMLSLLTIVKLNAQKYNSYNNENYTAAANDLKFTIYSADYKEGKKKIDEFIKKNKFTITNQNETKNSHHYEITARENNVAAIDSFCNTLGYISNKNLNSYNNDSKLSETKLELERLENKKKEYEKMLVRIDSVKSDKYYTHWEKIRVIETEIYDTRKKIDQLESVHDVYAVSINMNDEQSSPTSSKVNFVHMPGVEYVYQITESPKAGLSYEAYQGYCLKYLFTKGKSYVSLGALKAVNPDKSDLNAYDEMFCFTFGQDWYSRYLGRGGNKFCNLYIGYQSGMFIAYNNTGGKAIPFASPSTGIELFKNKYLLIDTNVNYFLPISQENRSMRGWRLGGSVNFSF